MLEFFIFTFFLSLLYYFLFLWMSSVLWAKIMRYEGKSSVREKKMVVKILIVTSLQIEWLGIK